MVPGVGDSDQHSVSGPHAWEAFLTREFWGSLGMIFVCEASAAVVLVTLTLSLQCAGMAALIGWARTSLTRDIHKLGPLRSAVFMVRFTTVIMALHVLQILLWAGFYRWLCFPLWESAFYFSTSSYATVG